MMRAEAMLSIASIGSNTGSEGFDALTSLVLSTVCTADIGRRPLCRKGLGECTMRLSVEAAQSDVRITGECGLPSCGPAVVIAVARCASTLQFPVRYYSGADAIQKFLKDHDSAPPALP